MSTLWFGACKCMGSTCRGSAVSPCYPGIANLRKQRAGRRRGIPTRAAACELRLSRLASLPTTPLRVLRSAAQIGGLQADGNMDAAFADFILDGSKTTTFAHKVWQAVIRAGDTVMDATCGNGHDTLMLAKVVLQGKSAGCVIGLDLQQSALYNTASLLDRELPSYQRERVKLLHLCHSQLDQVVDESSVRLVAFNLGYQPGGDKGFTTRAETTIKAISAAVKVVKRQGLISIMSYVGHPGGRDEFEAVRAFGGGLPADEWVCSHLEWINRPLGPHLMLLLRK